MSAFRLSTRYAKSLIQLAQEKGKLEEVFADMKTLDNVFEKSREFKLLFRSPIIASDKKLAIFKKLFEGKLTDIVFSFVVLLIKKGREPFLHEISDCFVEQYNVISGITIVNLKSAVQLDKGLVQSMISSLKNKEHIKEVQLRETVDESLIGGFVLEYNGKMIDASVKNKIHELRGIIEDDSYVKKYA
jgi:F-type H+-transporting ATPase subunit delta